MHAACSSNGSGRRHAPETSTPGDRLGAAFGEPAAPPENGGGRDARGRFAPGNAGGPGNPFARRTAELRREFLAEATGEDLRAVCRALLERAKEGDVAAAKLAMSYLVGKPEKAVDPDTLDEQEWHIWRRYTASSEWVDLIQCLPLDVILNLVRSVWPVLAREKCAQGQALFATPGPVPPESEGEAASAKPRARRRRGKGKRPEGEESSAGMAVAVPASSTEEPRPEEAGPLGCPYAVGAAEQNPLPDAAEEAPASECIASDGQAARLCHDEGETRGVVAEWGTPADVRSEGERPQPAPEGLAGSRRRADGVEEHSCRPGAGESRPYAPGRMPGESGGNRAAGGEKCPSPNEDNGTGPTARRRDTGPVSDLPDSSER
jgi:hypothetical protein